MKNYKNLYLYLFMQYINPNLSFSNIKEAVKISREILK